MITQYKHFFSLLMFSLSLSFISSGIQAATPTEPLWPTLKVEYFGDKSIRAEATDLLYIDAPKRAEDAAIVPFTIKLMQPQTADKYVKHLYFIIDNNPQPMSADFELSPDMGLTEVSTRMRVEQYTFVRAVAEMNDGSLHMVEKFVKASGGCAAPAGKDAAAALARLGKMQIRMRKPTIGEPVQAQVIVSHPNYNGLQFDQKSARYIEEHSVRSINVTYNDKLLVNVKTGISISEDPSLRFTFVPEESGELKAVVVDSKDQTFTQQKDI